MIGKRKKRRLSKEERGTKARVAGDLRGAGGQSLSLEDAVLKACQKQHVAMSSRA